MRAKRDIIEDLLVLEESMNWSDNPEYVQEHDCLTAELKVAIDAEIREQVLEEMVSLEGYIQQEDTAFTVDHQKIKDLVQVLLSKSVFK